MYPIVVDSNDNILWIPGLKKSQFDRKNSIKYDIILKYEQERMFLWEKRVLKEVLLPGLRW